MRGALPASVLPVYRSVCVSAACTHALPRGSLIVGVQQDEAERASRGVHALDERHAENRGGHSDRALEPHNSPRFEDAHRQHLKARERATASKPASRRVERRFGISLPISANMREGKQSSGAYYSRSRSSRISNEYVRSENCA